VEEGFSEGLHETCKTPISYKVVPHLDNTMAFKADQAFEGTWDIKNQQGWLFNAKKSEQKYSGSFQTQKNIEFRDLGKK
jgi:hypothetical protein